jgi:hypothetical protein
MVKTDISIAAWRANESCEIITGHKYSEIEKFAFVEW